MVPYRPDFPLTYIDISFLCPLQNNPLTQFYLWPKHLSTTPEYLSDHLISQL